jgi:hypothetical protein
MLSRADAIERTQNGNSCCIVVTGELSQCLIRFEITKLYFLVLNCGLVMGYIDDTQHFLAQS